MLFVVVLAWVARATAQIVIEAQSWYYTVKSVSYRAVNPRYPSDETLT